jgi:TPR repeat protein
VPLITMVTASANSFSAQQYRPRIGPDPLSPQEVSWDNPFPGFPGVKKKTSISEEQKIIQNMAAMEINDPRRQNSAGSREHPDGGRRGPPAGGQSRGYPPQQQGFGSQGQRPVQAPGPGYGGPVRQNTYDQGYPHASAGVPTSPIRDGFAPPGRSMTMPTEMGIPGGQGNQTFQANNDGFGPSAPYNGPAGRVPPRPSTATGGRPPPQRQYPPQDPQPAQQQSSHQHSASISDLYDSYYDPEPSQPNPSHTNGKSGSLTSEIPDFDRAPVAQDGHKRGMSIEEHIKPPQNGGMPQRKEVNGYSAMSRTKSQPDFRVAQPQSAVYEMAGDAPPMPAGSHQEYPSNGYDQNSGPTGIGAGNVSNGGGYNGYDHGDQQGYGQPQRNDYGNQRPIGPPLPAGRIGLPSGPGPQHKGMGPPPRTNSMPQDPSPGNQNPSHPPPVRAGLIPNSVANQANNKPPPVRNYNNNSAVAPIPQGNIAAPTANSPAPASTPAPVTLQEIERLKAIVKANPNDQINSLTLAKRCIEASDVLVAKLPDQRSRNKAREKYIFDAHKILKKLVASQNAEAMFLLADCYGRGSLGLETDNKEAFTLYQSAAKAGHAAAAYRTAVCCELGNDDGGGTRKDPLKAIQWYKRAAMLGDTPAMYKMGMILLKGLLGQPKNPREAIGWLKRAAERADPENPHALHELALLYQTEQPPDGSSNIIRDEPYSLSLFQQAADLGYKFSQFRLGCAYEYGLFNQPINPRLSIMWYSRAAVQEEHQSELALSGWYLTGSEGVLQQSDTEAYLWARKAAMAGLAKAEYAMGYFTEVGIGAPADLEGAKRWYWRAAGMSFKLEISSEIFTNRLLAQNFPKARERLEDLKRGGPKGQLRSRERVSRSKIGKQNEGECAVM